MTTLISLSSNNLKIQTMAKIIQFNGWHGHKKEEEAYLVTLNTDHITTINEGKTDNGHNKISIINTDVEGLAFKTHLGMEVLIELINDPKRYRI